jgi:hypothetical protein
METLAKHFREITRAAFARHGFAQADVVANWAAIVGEDLAAASAPDRIKWPKGAGEEAQKGGGTLVIRAAPGRALELQYEASRIMARINSFFGYGAIARIKIMQAAGLPAGPPPKPAIPDNPVLEQEVARVDDAALRAALTRLGRGVAMCRRSSPQGK